MLVASIALHIGLGAGFALSYFHTKASSTGNSNSDIPSEMTLIGSVETPTASPNHPSSLQASLSPGGKRSQTPSLPTPPPAPVQKAVPPVTPRASLALEANPNAHLRDIPFEAVLSPHPVPHLDGDKGIAFVLDVSGSMYEPYAGSTRLAFARTALEHRLRALPDGTPFAVILYAERSIPSGPLVAASDLTRDAAIRFMMHDVNCGGGTNLPDGLAWAVQLHTRNIVVISDGDLNTSLENLLINAGSLLGRKGASPALDIVGIAPRPHTDDELLLQALASHQGGPYHTEQLDDAPTLMANRTIPASP